jgi:exo-beta-1,3-glucanase (GH17 family)
MRVATALFALAALGIIAVWAWLGAAVEMPQAASGPAERLYCISYAPFRAGQDPFGPDTPIDPRQIDEDLAQLKQITSCVRTYSVDHGLDQIPEIARRHGLKVMQGLWLSSLPDLSRKQVEMTVALANRYPEVIQSIVVGNEVLLRGEMSAPVLAQTIREVKARVPMPVTYADVWEFWLRNRELAAAVDFITIHILPYWEDLPIPARDAARHVDAIRKQVVAAFPGKEVLIGEFGWPSAGRMREAALPSRINQARTLQEVVAQASRDGYRVNVIEAYDQPWKRKLEGTVGGHWGLFDAYQRRAKFKWRAPVSNHPLWRWQAAAGVALAAVAFGAAWLAGRGRTLLMEVWARVAVICLVSGALAGLTIANVSLESLTWGDWLRSLAWASAALTAPVMVAASLLSEANIPSFVRMLGPHAQRPRQPLEFALGILLLLLVVLAVQSALGLVFDPRYRDFPFAPLLGAAVPLLIATTPKVRPGGPRPVAQNFAALTLVLAAVYILFNESLANWQAVWLCTGLVVLAVTLLRVRDVRD